MTVADLQTQPELEQDFITRLIAYTASISWFGRTGIARAIAYATSWMAYNAHRLYAQALARRTLRASAGDDLALVAAEYGAEKNELGTRSKILVVVVPVTATVTAVNGPKTHIEVDDSTTFAATQSIRIRDGDGSTTDVRTISSISVGTGPNGGDELVVTALTGTYTPASDDVQVTIRHTVIQGTTVTTSAGVSFQTLEELVTGDANPVLNGENTALALADKVWCEATITGEVGNIDPDTVEDFSPAIAEIISITNPSPGSGGTSEESDPELKYRAAHTSSQANQETLAWLESILQASSWNVLRAVPSSSGKVGVMGAKVLHRNGGTFSTTDLAAMADYVEQRVRSHLTVELDNVTLTAVQIEATITKDGNATLREIGVAAAADLATFLDLRTWAAGQDPDNADLLDIINDTVGVATVETTSFLPATNPSVPDDSYPVLASLALLDAETGETFNATLAVSF